MATGLFTDYRFYKLLDHDEEGTTYVMQYSCESRENYDRYINLSAPELREKAIKKWGDGFVAFESLMQVV